MQPILAWLDFNTAERERAQRVLALLDQREARDELGLGGIRDSFSDYLFPGTSTIQTRLRYLFFVPWIYQDLDRRRTPSREVVARARKIELDRQPGYQSQRFLRNAKSINRIEDEATVLRLIDGKSYVCGDYGESLVYAPDGAIAAKCGLNIKVVADALRKAAFPDAATGAGYLRWPSELPLPNEAASLPFGVVVLLRQTIRMDKKGGWTEQSNSLHCLVGGDGEFSEADKPTEKRLIEGLLTATIRKSSENLPALTRAIARTEEQWVERLRRPSETELNSQIRHSVMPLFAAIITS